MTKALKTANRGDLQVLGKASVRIRGKRGRWVTVQTLVVRNLICKLIISADDQKLLGMLPPGYPDAVCVANDPEGLRMSKLEQFADVISDEAKGGTLKGDPMTIHLSDRTISPLRVFTAKRIPIHLQNDADKLRDNLLKAGIIKRVDEPTDWISPAKFLPKPNGKGVRLVTDFTHLNRAVRRPVHPFPSAQDIVRMVRPGSRVFAKLDAIHGYFQVPLDEESQKLTTVLLPDGKYCYTSAPMGLSSSGDEFCRRTDDAFRGLDYVAKIVDDVLIQADDYEQLSVRIDEFLERCREFGINMSEKKFEVGECVKMAGYIVSSLGIMPDPDKSMAIAKFPQPKNISELRGFLGLANQFSVFFPELTQLALPLRGLLKKNTPFFWSPDIDMAFRKCREFLSGPAVLKPFDPQLETILLTDASRLHGLGYVLLQSEGPGKVRLVQAGSRSVSAAEQNYASVELECLAVQWAALQCSYYLQGMPHFQIITDHKPLIGIFSKNITDIDNDRLRRIREKIMHLTFTITWSAGKEHLIADALSRSPVESAVCAVSEVSDFSGEIARVIRDDPAFGFIRAAAVSDAMYQQVAEAVRSDRPELAPAFQKLFHDLSIVPLAEGGFIVMNGERVVLPDKAKGNLLRILHKPHCGITKTLARAKQLFFWFGMNNDITQLIAQCDKCQEIRPSQQREPMTLEIAHYPMEKMGIDLFHAGNSMYLVCVDRFSGFTLVKALKATTTAAVCNHLEEWFSLLGYPRFIRTDGGPQFRDVFRDWCVLHHIILETSSPYNPASNGLAEAGVKNAKHLLLKCKSRAEFGAAMLEWRNTPRADGVSPAEAFFGRAPRGALPDARSHAMSPLQAERARSLKKGHDARALALPLAPLSPGTRIRVRDPVTGQWGRLGTITQAREHGRSYWLDLDGGGRTMRTRRFLRPVA